MRGAPIMGCGLPAVGRIIPADAGSTALYRVVIDTHGDHPRGCGEHLDDRPFRTVHDWIIPADAGSTIQDKRIRPRKGDHPRGCGEHARRTGRSSPRPGSSPRMRGAPHDECSHNGRTRIIPADAGSTPVIWMSLWRPWDHPRGCGEHDGWATEVANQTGSSPRMRGAPDKASSDDMDERIIPADAGSTLTCAMYGVRSRDHPRGCGEHFFYVSIHSI